MHMFIVRHGETVENVGQIHQGHMHGTLTEKGREQAGRLAERLKSERFDIIYSSDLGRAADTAKIIAAYHPGTPVRYAKELRERDMASYEGKPWEDEWDWEDLPKNVEQNASMMDRARRFLERAYHRHIGGTILVVSHGGLINALLAAIDGREMAEERFVLLGNTSITIVEFTEDRKHRIHLLNCVAHLEAKTEKQ